MASMQHSNWRVIARLNAEAADLLADLADAEGRWRARDDWIAQGLMLARRAAPEDAIALVAAARARRRAGIASAPGVSHTGILRAHEE
jgi:hypothetical protein